MLPECSKAFCEVSVFHMSCPTLNWTAHRPISNCWKCRLHPRTACFGQPKQATQLQCWRNRPGISSSHALLSTVLQGRTPCFSWSISCLTQPRPLQFMQPSTIGFKMRLPLTCTLKWFPLPHCAFSCVVPQLAINKAPESYTLISCWRKFTDISLVIMAGLAPT